MLFTYEMKIPVGNEKTVSKEIDGELIIERNGDWSIALYCEESREYEPVHNETDLYGDISEWLHEKEAFRVNEEMHNSERNIRWLDREQARH